MNDFTELGLSTNESKVYSTVVKLGKSGAALISKESGVSYSRIYDILASLEHKGLIKVLPEKGKKFISGDPEVLKSLIKKKQELLGNLDKEVDDLKKIYAEKEKEPIEIAQGRKNFYKLERELPTAKISHYNIKYTSEYQPVWERDYKNHFRGKIDFKELVRYDEETKKNVHRWLKLHRNIKIIKNEGVALDIRDDKTLMIALIKSNTLVLIRDKPFIDLMKTLFNTYYEHTENTLDSKTRKNKN